MKKLMFLTCLCLLAASLHAQVKYRVNGKLPAKYGATKAIMSYPENGIYKADTTDIRNDNFEFKGITGRPEMAELNLVIPRPAGAPRRGQSAEGEGGNNMKNVAIYYLDGNISVLFDTAGMAKVTGGGKEQKIWKEYGDSTAVKMKQNSSMELLQQYIASFIKKYPDSYVSVDLLELFAGNMQPAEFEPMYNLLSARMKKVDKVMDWKKALDEAKKLDSGEQPSSDFTLNDTEGKPVALSSYKGGYVLLDLWASWCVPCRAENPNLVAAYSQYKHKNFRILAVSLDTDKAAWLKAIGEDKLPWTQVSDLKGAESEVTKLYNVSSIPQNFLIDPNGKIIGRNLRGKSLQDKLASVLK